jgi:hypothetical protein
MLHTTQLSGDTAGYIASGSRQNPCEKVATLHSYLFILKSLIRTRECKYLIENPNHLHETFKDLNELHPLTHFSAANQKEKEKKNTTLRVDTPQHHIPSPSSSEKLSFPPPHSSQAAYASRSPPPRPDPTARRVKRRRLGDGGRDRDAPPASPVDQAPRIQPPHPRGKRRG